MKIIPIDKVEKKRVEMEGASGAWKQLTILSKDGAPVHSGRYAVFRRRLNNLQGMTD